MVTLIGACTIGAIVGVATYVLGAVIISFIAAITEVRLRRQERKKRN